MIDWFYSNSVYPFTIEDIIMKDYVAISTVKATKSVNFWNTRGGYILSCVLFGMFVYAAGYFGLR